LQSATRERITIIKSKLNPPPAVHSESKLLGTLKIDLIFMHQPAWLKHLPAYLLEHLPAANYKEGWTFRIDFRSATRIWRGLKMENFSDAILMTHFRW